MNTDVPSLGEVHLYSYTPRVRPFISPFVVCFFFIPYFMLFLKHKSHIKHKKVIKLINNRNKQKTTFCFVCIINYCVYEKTFLDRQEVFYVLKNKLFPWICKRVGKFKPGREYRKIDLEAVDTAYQTTWVGLPLYIACFSMETKASMG